MPRLIVRLFSFPAIHLITLLAALSLPYSAGADEPRAQISPAADATAAPPRIKTSSGLQYEDTKIGSGEVAHAGQTVTVHYTGWLKTRDGSTGRKFDSSRDKDQPFKFRLGAKQVIQGWDEGVEGMRVGGMRKLIVPSYLGYGSKGAPPSIPPNAALIFEVELLGF